MSDKNSELLQKSKKRNAEIEPIIEESLASNYS